jgi:hypothetical protein
VTLFPALAPETLKTLITHTRQSCRSPENKNPGMSRGLGSPPDFLRGLLPEKAHAA